MRSGIRIGSWFGVEIAADRSWIFIFLLVVWNLTVVFGRQHPSWGVGANLALAVAAALLFFASILLHEFAHAMVARAFGIPVRSITLFLFGGVSNIEREPPTAAAEFWMAIAGPLTSIALGVGLVGLWLLLGRTGSAPTLEDLEAGAARPDALSTLLLWLGPINVTIGVFNLIPGFPLDGGRVLRAILWRLMHDLHRATRWAAAVGQAIGWTFVVIGIAALFGARVPFAGSGIAGIWLAFIGWFLASAAEGSYRSLLVHDALEGVAVWRLMRASVPSVPVDAPVGEVVRDEFLRSDEDALPVTESDRFVGMLSVSDIRNVPRDRWDTTPVHAVMTAADRLPGAAPHEPVADALRKLTESGSRQLPVLQGGRLVGVLLARDVARWVELHVEPPPGRRPVMTH